MFSNDSPIYYARGAQFGPVLTTTGITGVVVAAIDGVGTTSDGCETLTNAAEFTGNDKIALIDRGDCTFVTKVQNAEDAGAIGVIIANNAGDSLVTMSSDGDAITISSVFIGQGDGGAIREALLLPSVMTATLRSGLAPQLMRDGDVDSDIIWHEYGHGLTWRMIGSMNGAMSGAIGEGMSDTLSILINNDDVVGEYSASDPIGIRSAPYTGYPRTYGDFSGASVHFDGEIYAAITWRLWELFQAGAIPKDTLFDYLIGGMNFTPSGPAFEDMRNGILQAASGTGHECLIWQAFADFGAGEGASAVFSPPNWVITESFTLPASCAGGGNAAPVAVDDGPYGVAEGGTEVVNAVEGVLFNDSDSDGPSALTAEVMSPPANGELTLNPDGSFSYTHDGGETASDSFTYRAYDGAAYSSPATASITVNAVNDPPVAIADSLTVAEGGTQTVLASGQTSVLFNDTDAEDDPLTAVLVSGPSNGTLTVFASDGTFSYTHGGGETTSDSFTYKANDGAAYSNVTTVSITITGANNLPVADDDPVSVAAHQWINFDVLYNDSDPDGDPLTVTAVSIPTNLGEVSINDDNTLRYRRHKRFGSDACDDFTYTISDGNGGFDTASVYVSVGSAVCAGGGGEPPPPPPPSGVHVGDLDGATTGGGPKWTATVTITVHKADETAGPADTRVNVAWSGGFAGDDFCVTDVSGQCPVTSALISNKNKSVTLTVTGVGDPDYNQAENHDPDGDSDGTAITVNK